MAIELSTAGIKFGYAVELEAGKRPTTGYIQIPGCKQIPEFNPEPATLETTPLDAKKFKTYIPGLQDIGGAVALTWNFNDEVRKLWDKELCVEAKAGKESGLRVWAEYWIPGMEDGYYYPFEPTESGFGGAEVDSVFEASLYVTPTGEPLWATAVEPQPKTV